MASQDSHPNILFLFTDQQRPDWFEMNPNIPVRTPHLKGLSERGVWLTRAICPSPVCGPSRSCVAAGREYDRCRVWSNDTDFPPELSTYHKRLRDEAGYHVMGAGKFHIGNNQGGNPAEFYFGRDGRRLLDEWGFSDGLFNAGKNQATILMRRNDGVPQDSYMGFLHERGLAEQHIDDYQRRNKEEVWTATFPTSLPDDAYLDNWIADNGLDLLERALADQPWYLEVNFQNPHHPWDITENMHRRYRDPEIDFPPPQHCDLDLAPQIHQEVRRNFAAMVEHLDDIVGRFIAKVKERGELENPLIVFSSDHGEMLGDYSQWQKLSPLQASVGVPFIIAGPGVMARGTCPVPATILDLHSTFLECAGLAPAVDVDSRSMSAFLAGETERHREAVFSGLSAWRLAFDGRHKLVRGYDPDKRRGGDEWESMHVPAKEAADLQRQRQPLLYDSEGDERINVAAQFPEVFADLAHHLDEQLGH